MGRNLLRDRNFREAKPNDLGDQVSLQRKERTKGKAYCKKLYGGGGHSDFSTVSSREKI